MLFTFYHKLLFDNTLHSPVSAQHVALLDEVVVNRHIFRSFPMSFHQASFFHRFISEYCLCFSTFQNVLTLMEVKAIKPSTTFASYLT